MGESRKKCPAVVQADILIEQDNRCLYCGLRFGDLVVRKGNDWQWLEINWDHFVPHAYSQANPHDGWVAACHLCNTYKASLMFEDVAGVRLHVLQKAVKNEHDPLPFWTPEAATLTDAPAVEPAGPAVDVEVEADVTLTDDEPGDDAEEYEPDLAVREHNARVHARARATEDRRRRAGITVDEWIRTHPRVTGAGESVSRSRKPYQRNAAPRVSTCRVCSADIVNGANGRLRTLCDAHNPQRAMAAANTQPPAATED